MKLYFNRREAIALQKFVYSHLHGEFIYSNALSLTELLSLKSAYKSALNQQKCCTNLLLIVSKMNEAALETVSSVMTGELIVDVNKNFTRNSTEEKRLETTIQWAASQLVWLSREFDFVRQYKVNEEINRVFADVIVRQRLLLGGLLTAKQNVTS